MPTHFRRYYQYVEKDSAKVSSVWKVVHTVIFTMLVVNSFFTAYTFHKIYDSFNFQCVLYSDPFLYLQEMEVFNLTTTTTTTTENSSSSSSVTPMTGRKQAKTTTITTTTEEEEEETTTTTTEKTTATPKVELSDKRYWMTNASAKGKVMMDYRKTRFGSKSICNTMLFVPLSSVVLASFATVMVVICGKGGRGYKSDILTQAWSYVYPILIYSAIMFVVSCVLGSMLSAGMDHFCRFFEAFTEEKRCSSKMNYFTGEVGVGNHNYYEMYIFCLWTSYVSMILWAAQVLWTLTRILFAADFTLVIVTISCDRRRSIQYDRVDEALKKSQGGGLKKVKFVQKDLPKDKDDDDDDTTQV